MGMNFMVPLRLVQEFFAILVLGTNAYVAAYFSHIGSSTPSQISFLIFVGFFTAAIAIPYLTIAPRYFPNLANRFVVLAAEAVTMLFWFAGFVAASVFMAGLGFCRGSVCSSAKAGVAFAAFNWVLFTSTTIMAVMYVFRSRNTEAAQRKNRMNFMDNQI